MHLRHPYPLCLPTIDADTCPDIYDMCSLRCAQAIKCIADTLFAAITRFGLTWIDMLRQLDQRSSENSVYTSFCTNCVSGDERSSVAMTGNCAAL